MIKVGYHGKGTAVARIELQTTQAPGDCADHLTITNPMFIASQWKISSWNFQVLNFDSKRKKRPMHFECRQFQPRWEKNPALNKKWNIWKWELNRLACSYHFLSRFGYLLCLLGVIFLNDILSCGASLKLYNEKVWQLTFKHFRLLVYLFLKTICFLQIFGSTICSDDFGRLLWSLLFGKLAMRICRVVVPPLRSRPWLCGLEVWNQLILIHQRWA